MIYLSLGISTMPRVSLRKLYHIRLKSVGEKAHHWNEIYVKNLIAGKQLRWSSFYRRKITGGKGLLSQTTPVKNESLMTLKRIAYAAKLVRFPFLLVALSSIGYQRGVTDAIRNPMKLQQGAFEAMLMEFSVESKDDVEIVTERGVRSRFDTPLGSLARENVKASDPRSDKIALVGREIMKSAQVYVREKFETAVEQAKDRITKDGEFMKEQQLTKLLNEDSEVQFWIAALEHVEGTYLQGSQNWSYVLIPSPVPNAFVSEMLPQKIFITTGLFEKFVNNDDELAMILGHEVSHLIMGHFSASSYIESLIRGIEIFVLMLDPTEGLLSLGIAGFLSSGREALVAAFSRTHEVEADELGCKLAAMSCYDTRRGIEVYRKMQVEAVKDGSVSKQNLMSSHPSSQERYNALRQLVETENFLEYSYCNTLRKRIARALKSKDI
mmetsp:Transcript_666/g.1419  ORF Transcript_666/g.1419 Transcript_666/m.1419 type:complete len:439 (+) Transcript_666:51-1367(+)